jgi:hypothetical protein
MPLYDFRFAVVPGTQIVEVSYKDKNDGDETFVERYWCDPKTGFVHWVSPKSTSSRLVTEDFDVVRAMRIPKKALGNPDDLAEEIRQRWYLRDDLHWQPEDAAIAAAYRKARIGGT